MYIIYIHNICLLYIYINIYLINLSIYRSFSCFDILSFVKECRFYLFRFLDYQMEYYEV